MVSRWCEGTPELLSKSYLKCVVCQCPWEAAAQEHPCRSGSRGEGMTPPILLVSQASGLCKRLWISLLGYNTHDNAKDLHS